MSDSRPVIDWKRIAPGSFQGSMVMFFEMPDTYIKVMRRVGPGVYRGMDQANTILVAMADDDTPKQRAKDDKRLGRKSRKVK